MKFDKTDLGIIRILQKDARTPLSEISKKLGISRPTVKERIGALQKTGLIKKFTVVLNKSAIVKNFSVYVLVKAKNNIAGKLGALEEIQELHLLIGNKIMLKANVKDISSLHTLIEKINSFGAEIEYHLVSKTIKEESSAEIGPEIGITLECDLCGQPIAGEIFKFKLHNREHYFCCPTCLKKFKEREKNSGDRILKKNQFRAAQTGTIS